MRFLKISIRMVTWCNRKTSNRVGKIQKFNTMKAKKLKKLELRKTEIANLNDDEMYQIQGGSTWPCAVGSAVVASVISITFEYGQYASAWMCEPGPYDGVSQRYIDGTCYMPTVNIYSIYTA